MFAFPFSALSSPALFSVSLSLFSYSLFPLFPLFSIPLFVHVTSATSDRYRPTVTLHLHLNPRVVSEHKAPCAA